MAATPPSNPKSAGDDRKLVSPAGGAALSFEEKVHEFWKRNQNLVLGTCAAVVLAILAKGGWDHLQRQNHLRIGGAYAAATTTEQLKSFAAEHRNHPLGAIAELRIADEAYAGGKSTDAIAGYDPGNVQGLRERVIAHCVALACAELCDFSDDAEIVADLQRVLRHSVEWLGL